jgi:hypothetical protein
MQSNFRTLKLAVSLLPFFSASFCISMTGCTHKNVETPPPDLAQLAVTLGKPAFLFDPQQTISLNIAKADPISGETWSARVEKTQPNGLWQIVSYSGESQLSDRLANKAWINHFLETLQTFRADSVMPETDSTHFGFSPPRYSVDWRIQPPDGAKTTTYELRVGTPVDFEKNPDGEAFTLFPPNPQIFQAGGASLVMLRYLKSFSSLRLETLSTIEAGEVTEISVTGKHRLHSKFNGQKWTGSDVSELVPFLTHLRIERFIDGVQFAKSKSQLFTPVLTIQLTDRYSHISTLSFDAQDLGKNSDRGDVVFQMFAGSVVKLESFY